MRRMTGALLMLIGWGMFMLSTAMFVRPFVAIKTAERIEDIFYSLIVPGAFMLASGVIGIYGRYLNGERENTKERTDTR